VSMAIANHEVASTAVISANTLTRVVPIFVALMVWVIRILIIGSLSVAGDRLAREQARRPAAQHQRPAAPSPMGRPVASSPSLSAAPRTGTYERPLTQTENGVTPARSEPTYQSVLMRSRPVPPSSLSRKGPGMRS
ncbi:MAG: hypothetical protein HPY76_06690, partial [Anaerolineae bacterium]|nr:hypothetical protein [Anaerolineae bacterium]